ncbi:uncharacterized protein LOC144485342, partial [Mustelus asterias]
MAEGFNSGVYPISSKRLTLDNDPNSKITEFLTNCKDDQLLLLTKFYRDRLEQAIEGVARLCLMFAACDHIGVKQSHKVKEIADSGNLADCSKLLLNLVIEKGPRALRVMWESFVEMHRGLPKLEKILRELPTLGPDAFVHMNIPQGLSEVPSNLKATLNYQNLIFLFCVFSTIVQKCFECLNFTEPLSMLKTKCAETNKSGSLFNPSNVYLSLITIILQSRCSDSEAYSSIGDKPHELTLPSKQAQPCPWIR